MINLVQSQEEINNTERQQKSDITRLKNKNFHIIIE